MSAPGLIPRFHELARVPAVGRQALSRRTIEVYTSHVRAFYRFTGGKPAAQWTGGDVSKWMWHLDAEGYAPKSRGQALCAVIWVLKHVLQLDLEYGRREVIREGFPDLTPAEFVAMYCRHNGCTPETVVTRLAFSYLD